ncbi:MAG: FeoC-like transcriptional regulator [Actinomycetota bacterium]
MTILDRVLEELRSAKGPIRSNDLATKVGVSETALDGMISVLVAKGKLAGSDPEPIEETVACSGIACGTSCVGLEKCPFIADVPETYALVIQPPPPS